MVNSTKKECQDNARTINTLNRKTTNLNQNLSNDINKLLNGIGGMIQKKFLHVNQKIDSNFNNTMLAHNYFLESCHRIQLEEPQMEAKIVNVVETLLSLITNKTMIMGGEIYYLQDLLRTHDTEIQNKVGLAKNTLLEMAQKSFTYKQETVQTLLEMKNNLNQWLNYTADILNNNKTDHYEKLNAIEQTLQNVHNYIINLNVSKNREIELNANKLIEYIEKNINTTNFNTSNKMEQHFENINSFLNKIHDKIVEKQSPINLRHNRSKNTTQLIKNGTHDTTLEPQQHTKKFNESELIIGNLNDATSIVDLDVDFNYSTDLIEDDTEDIDFTY
ncbi:reticulocyte-binding protein PFD0110w-like [Chrysoperla carnea]|uniref:reticulocyte-binding protein PFD0110w-like n=1 Tax=Chrysoperla carnea TaxID=189513 RepID=UPI001D097F1C|nr:reticulocyte-binding protein PFD0110w-like [Chrysoperla carnea]